MLCRDALCQRARGPLHGGPGHHAAVSARLSALEERPPMSLHHLGARMTRLEAQRVRTTSPSGLVIVWMADGDKRATALQRAGLTLAEMASRVVLFVQYEETRSHALSPPNAAGGAGRRGASCG